MAMWRPRVFLRQGSTNPFRVHQCFVIHTEGPDKLCAERQACGSGKYRYRYRRAMQCSPHTIKDRVTRGLHSCRCLARRTRHKQYVEIDERIVDQSAALAQELARGDILSGRAFIALRQLLIERRADLV